MATFRTEMDAVGAVRTLLEWFGEDPSREGLEDTPERVVRAWEEMLSGYNTSASEVLSAVFQADGYDEMVVVRDIEFHSTCEHHLLPFEGHATVGYIPGEKVVGLSKVARLVDVFARRLQIQERMTRQIADALQDGLKPLGVGVVVKARHMCMACRGVRKQQAEMVTSALLGVFRESGVRSEFMSIATQP